MANIKEIEPVELTKWPQAIPHTETEFCFSMVCGNSHLHWAMHEPVVNEDALEPTLFWRTPYLSDDDYQTNHIELLAQYLPFLAKERIFGPEGPYTAQRVRQYAALRRIPSICVYILSTVAPAKEKTVEFLFQSLPVRLWKLQLQDFSVPGTYPSLGIDRMAAVRAAMDLMGPPTLVIDGGTALTYTALDVNGHFMGGGIGAGVNMKLAALHEKTGKLPLIDPKSLKTAITKRTDPGEKPLNRFVSSDTNEALMAGVLYELTESLIGTIEAWRNSVGASASAVSSKKPKLGSPQPPRQVSPDGSTESDSYSKHNKDLNFFVAGGDASLLEMLLQPDHSGIIESVGDPKRLEDWTIINEKNHLCHRAVTGLIQRKRLEWPLDDVRHRLIGQRVARSFANDPDSEGDIIHRASVISIEVGKSIDDDWFMLKFDDGTLEELQVAVLYYGLQTYKEKGEKASFRAGCSPAERELMVLKKSQAVECIELLQLESKKVKALRQCATEDRTRQPAIKQSTPPASQEQPGLKSCVEPVEPVSKRPRAESLPLGERAKPTSSGKEYLNQRVAKTFNGTLHFGSVKEFIPSEESPDKVEFWHILYDDGDEEDFEWKELSRYLKKYKDNAAKDTKPNPK